MLKRVVIRKRGPVGLIVGDEPAGCTSIITAPACLGDPAAAKPDEGPAAGSITTKEARMPGFHDR